MSTAPHHTLLQKLEEPVGKLLEEQLPRIVASYLEGLIETALHEVPHHDPETRMLLNTYKEKAIATTQHTALLAHANLLETLEPTLIEITTLLKNLLQQR